MAGRALLAIVLSVVAPNMGSAQAPAFAASSQPSTDNSEPTLLLASEEWRALALGTGPSRLCYVAPAAKARPALGQRDPRPLFYVTHRPARHRFDTVAFVGSHAFRAESLARVSFDSGPSHRLFTDGAFAWAGDEASDRRIVRAMSEAATLTVTGLGADGLLREDSFPLQGFVAAFQHASSECQRPGPPIKR